MGQLRPLLYHSALGRWLTVSSTLRLASVVRDLEGETMRENTAVNTVADWLREQVQSITV